MPPYNNVKSPCTSVRLVDTRTDFLFVYLSSLLTMLVLVFGAWLIQTPDMPLREIWYVFPSAAITAFLLPLLVVF